MRNTLISLVGVLAILAAGAWPVVQGKVQAAEDKRIAEIRQRLFKATPCPWESDGGIVGWWNNEQPGVEIRAKVNETCEKMDPKYGCMQGSLGGPVAEVSSAYWSGSRDPIADADFIAHSCADIQYLLHQLDDFHVKYGNVIGPPIATPGYHVEYCPAPSGFHCTANGEWKSDLDWKLGWESK